MRFQERFSGAISVACSGTTNQSSASPIVVGQQLVVGFADGSLVSFNKFIANELGKNLAEKINLMTLIMLRQLLEITYFHFLMVPWRLLM